MKARESAIGKLADNFVHAMRAELTAVSLAEGVRAVRLAYPACHLSDQQLENIIAIKALRHGLAVHFDRRMKQGSARVPS